MLDKDVVVEIGKHTELGNIATNLNKVKDEKSPLTIRINKFSKQISVFIVAIAVVVFIIMLLQGNSKLHTIFISVIAQVGDLIMSVIKRHYGIKDYGKIFPGHGGILDRFDSVMAVSVVLTFICSYFNLFT